MKKFISIILIQLTYLQPVLSIAYANDYAQQGKADAIDVFGGTMQDFQFLDEGSAESGTLFEFDDGSKVSIDEMFGTKHSSVTTVPEAANMTEEEFEQQGYEAQRALTEGAGVEAQAYQLLEQRRGQPQPKIGNDPIFGSFDHVQSLLDGDSVSCEPVTGTYQEDIQTCIRTARGFVNTETCTVQHKVDKSEGTAVVKFAAISDDVTTVEFDLTTGSAWMAAPGDPMKYPYPWKSSVSTVDFDKVCGEDSNASMKLEHSYVPTSYGYGEKYVIAPSLLANGYCPPPADSEIEHWRWDDDDNDWTVRRRNPDGSISWSSVRDANHVGMWGGTVGSTIGGGPDLPEFNNDFAACGPRTYPGHIRSLHWGFHPNRSTGYVDRDDDFESSTWRIGNGTSIVAKIGDWQAANGTQTNKGTDTSVSLRVLEYPSCTNGLKGKVQVWDHSQDNNYKVEWSHAGEWHFSMSEITEDSWSGVEECGAFAENKRLEPEITCLDYFGNGPGEPGTLNNGNGTIIFPSEIAPSPISGVDRMCRVAQVKYTTKPFVDGAENSCEPLALSAQCALVSTTCADGTSEELVERMYTYGLARDPDSDYQYWVDRLDAGESYEKVKDEFFDNAETNGGDIVNRFSCVAYEETYDCGFPEGAGQSAACQIEDMFDGDTFGACREEEILTETTEVISFDEVRTCDELIDLEPCQVERPITPVTKSFTRNVQASCVEDQFITIQPEWAKGGSTGVNPDTGKTELVLPSLSSGHELAVMDVSINDRSNNASIDIIERPSVANEWTTRVKYSANKDTRPITDTETFDCTPAAPECTPLPPQFAPNLCSMYSLIGDQELARTCFERVIEYRECVDAQPAQQTCEREVVVGQEEYCAPGTAIDFDIEIEGLFVKDSEVIITAGDDHNPQCLREFDGISVPTTVCLDENPALVIGSTVVSPEVRAEIFGEGIVPGELGTSNLCRNAEIRYEYVSEAGESVNSGQFCTYENKPLIVNGEPVKDQYGYTVFEAVQTCQAVPEDHQLQAGADTCAPLNDQVEAGTCTLQAKTSLNRTGNTGIEYLWEYEYLCETDRKEVTTKEFATKYTCEGGIECMGDECVTPMPEKSDSFAKSVATLNALESAHSDMDCEIVDSTGRSNCQVFPGEAASCKEALGGWVDCCETPDGGGVSLKDYITMTKEVAKLDTLMMNISGSNPVTGSYAALRDPMAKGVTMTTEWFTSQFDNLIGAVGGDPAVIGDLAGSTTAALTSVQQQAMRYAQAITQDLFGDAAAGFVFETGKDGVVQFASATANMLNVVGAIYTAYKIADLLVNIIYACSNDEMSLDVDKQLKKAHRVGSYCHDDTLFGCVEKRTTYCVFSSPLSRIVNREVRKQVGMDWGSKRRPDCSGIPLSDFQKIDWDLVDLSEWIDILKITDNYNGNMELGFEEQTGNGNTVAESLEVDRLDTVERNIHRLEQGNMEEVNQAAEEEMINSHN